MIDLEFVEAYKKYKDLIDQHIPADVLARLLKANGITPDGVVHEDWQEVSFDGNACPF